METFNPDLYKDKVAVITGGTSGLGNAVAKKLASLGAKVYATGINSKETEVPNGLSIEPVELDVTDESAVRDFFGRLKQLDILFNAAGITGENERELETFKKVVQIHLTGTFFFSELARPLLKKSDVASNVDIVTFFCKPTLPDATYKNVHVFSENQADRSPGGTGTTAMVARMVGKGDLEIGEEVICEGFVGGTFKGKATKEVKLGNVDALITEITGKAFISGFQNILLDPEDPFKYGFMVD